VFNSSVKKSVSGVKVLESALDELPAFPQDEWTLLERVEFVNSLPCSNITCMEREGTAVVSDCKPPQTIDDWLMLAPVTLIGFIMTTAVYALRMLQKRYKTAVAARNRIRERAPEDSS
jgi:hypothetical protein